MLPTRPPYVDSPGDWPEHVRRLNADLTAAGIPEPTVYHLLDSQFDYPAAIPVALDWLENFDSRVPDGDDRVATRVALMHILWSDDAKQDPAVIDALFRQFDRTPPLSQRELYFAATTLRRNARPEDYQRVVDMISERADDIDTVNALLQAKFINAEMVALAIDWLHHLDERVPEGDARRFTRLNLLANLLDPQFVKGNREAVDVLLDQFSIDSPDAKRFRESAAAILDQVCQKSDLPGIAEVIRRDPGGDGVHLLIRALRKIKTAQSREFLTSLLDDPRTRQAAEKALGKRRG